jgi:hypothetical protein
MAMPGPMAAWARSTGAMLAVLELGQRLGQLGLERGDETRGAWRWAHRRARPADQHDAGGEGIGAIEISIGSCISVRIGQVPVMAKPARITASRKVSQPVRGVSGEE